MDKTKRALDLHRTAFKKICSKIEDDLSTNIYDIIDIQSNIKVLEEKMLQIAELNQLFFDLMLDSDDHEYDMNVEVEVMDSLSSKYHKLKLCCENLVCHKENSKKSDSKEMGNSQDLPEKIVTKETKECSRSNCEITEQEVQTRYGRRVKLPSRYKD
ncbi:hypothetical protein JTB14_020508 [Gonioctena quinquepunctata]|nr:hypothetical protein JTB14_020508 [Gonioctena quinquepunctata]